MNSISKLTRKYKIAQRLKEARKEAKFNQKDVAKILHCSRVTISRLETGNKDLSLEDAAKFSKVYNKNLYYFLGDD